MSAVQPRVLVTGGAGYLGTAVLARLHALDVAASGCDIAEREGVTRCDMADAAAVSALLQAVKPDVVIHAAALLPKSAADYDDPAQAACNLALLAALCAAKPKRVVFVSSMTVYGNPVRTPVDESDAAPLSAYARGKIEGERLLAAQGIAHASARLAGLFGGARRNGLVANLCAAAVAGAAPALPPAPLVWAAVHVEDAAQSLAQLALSGAAAGPVDIGYPGLISVARLVTLAEELTGRSFSYKVTQPDFAMKLARAAEFGAVPDVSFASRIAGMIAEARERHARGV